MDTDFNLKEQILTFKKIAVKNEFLLKNTIPDSVEYKNMIHFLKIFKKKIVMLDTNVNFTNIVTTALKIDRGLKKGKSEVERALLTKEIKLLIVANNVENLILEHLFLEAAILKIPVFMISSKENLARLLKIELKSCTVAGATILNLKKEQLIILEDYCKTIYE